MEHNERINAIALYLTTLRAENKKDMRKINFKKLKRGDIAISAKYGEGTVFGIWSRYVTIRYQPDPYIWRYVDYNKYGQQCLDNPYPTPGGDNIILSNESYYPAFKWRTFLENVAGASSAYSGVAITLALYEWLTNSVYLWSAIVVAVTTLVVFIISVVVLVKMDK